MRAPVSKTPVDVADGGGDLGANFRELAQFAERSEGETVTFGKAAADLGIDVDQRRDKVALLVAKHHDVADERRGSQAVFNELWRKGLAGAELAQILEPVEENELPALIEAYRVAGAKSVVGAAELRRRGFVLR